MGFGLRQEDVDRLAAELHAAALQVAVERRRRFTADLLRDVRRPAIRYPQPPTRPAPGRPPVVTPPRMTIPQYLGRPEPVERPTPPGRGAPLALRAELLLMRCRLRWNLRASTRKARHP